MLKSANFLAHIRETLHEHLYHKHAFIKCQYAFCLFFIKSYTFFALHKLDLSILCTSYKCNVS